MNKSKYSKETIVKACRMYATGRHTLAQIATECDFKSITPIRYHCDPEYRAKTEAWAKRWRKKNPKRAKEISAKASRVWYVKHHGKKA